LNAEQAALLAGAIINPRVHNPARPTRRLLRRQRIILSRMGGITPPAPTPAATPAPIPPAPQPDALEPDLLRQPEQDPQEAPDDPADTADELAPPQPSEPL
jgi:membrane peptidoglycan carboxypeptidase